MTEQDSSRQTKRRLRFWHVAGVLLILLLGAFAIYRVVGHVRFKGRLNAVRAAGLPVTLTELDQWYETPPYGENAADYIMEALSYLQTQDPNQRGQFPWLDRDKIPGRTESMDAETTRRVAQLLQANAETLRLLEESATCERSRYPVDLTQGHATLLPHLSDLSSAVRLLCLKAAFHSEEGKHDLAADALFTAFRVADSQVDEPLLISQMVRQSSYVIVLQALERVLSDGSPQQEHLTRLERTVRNAYDPNAMVRALAGERCMTFLILRRPRATGMNLPVVFNHEGPSLLQIHGAQMLGLADRCLVRYIDVVDGCIAALYLPSHERRKAALRLEHQEREMREAHGALTHFMPATYRFILNDLTHLTRLRLAEAALAVEQYRLAKGTLPEQLSDLVPAFAPGIPLDPYDGQPLRYHKLPKGYVVYSVGPDSSDEGGAERAKRSRGKEIPPYDITFIVER